MFLTLRIDNLNGDSDLYLNVANNLSNRCSFWFTNLSTGECEIIYRGLIFVCFILLSFLLFLLAELKKIFSCFILNGINLNLEFSL